MPFASPWVRLAAQKPPLRPLAPKPTDSASRTTTRSEGSESVRAIAVHKPVKPAPITTTSARPPEASGGRAGPAGLAASQ
jgi:hypothetical protein